VVLIDQSGILPHISSLQWILSICFTNRGKEVKVPTWVLVHPGHPGSENEEKRHFIGTSWQGIENEQE